MERQRAHEKAERVKDRFVEEILERIKAQRHLGFRAYRRATLRK